MERSLADVLENGDERIIGRSRQFLSAVLIALITIKGKVHIILEKRAFGIKQGGEISFPGGKFEKDDRNTRNTAVRESVEELGISCENIEVLGKFGTLVNPSGVILDAYVGKINISQLSEIKYNRAEVEKIILVPMDFFLNTSPKVEKIAMENIPLFSAKELKLPKRYEKSWAGRAREVYFYSYQNEVIWGMTAEIIYEFVQELKRNGKLHMEGLK